MKKAYYLAYGSNLNLRDMKYRCPSAKPIGTTILDGYRLVYKGPEDGYSYLTLEEAEGFSVPLGIFKLDEREIPNIDMYEGYPELYSKYNLTIRVGSLEKDAFIYIMNDGFNYKLPSQKYIDTCIEGYRYYGFDESILDKALISTISSIPKYLKK